MSEREKKLADTIGTTVQMLDKENQEFWFGFAEGVAAMAAKYAERKPEKKEG